MKKIITLCLALSFLFSFNAQAQLPDGSTAPDFTSTDLDGNTWNLYEILDQGKTVILDVSATWCGPCWDYHTGGTLETIWEDYGPDGTDEMVVFMIEGDAATTLDDLYGTGSNTTGDWVTGTHYPIIDDSAISDAYQITYYPTMYTICPDKLVTESGQISASAHYAVHNECATMAGTNNAGIRGLEDIGPECAAEITFSPEVTLVNYGSANMTEATFEVFANGSSLGVESWAGDLSTYQISEISLGSLTAAPGDVTVQVLTVNGGDDEDASNNEDVALLVGATGTETDSVTVTILTDNFGDETYWAIIDESGDIIADGGNEEVGLVNIGTNMYPPPAGPGTYANNTEYNITVGIPAAACYDFVVTDYFGDGLSVGTPGFYRLTDADGVVLFENAENFGDIAEELFAKSTFVSNEEIVLDNQLAIYPNPVTDQLNVEFSLIETANVSFEVVNAVGQVMVVQDAGTLATGAHTVSFNMNNFATGIYFVNLRTAEGVTSQRIIKQ